MADNKTKLLQKQIDKLNDDDFDLNAWKNGTTMVLERIFGPQNRKITAIEQIKYELSSWSLRDAKGSRSQLESCKQQGREILLTAIDELELLGAPGDAEKGSPIADMLEEALGLELKVADFKKVIEWVGSDEKAEQKRKKLEPIFENLHKDAMENILMALLTSETARVAFQTKED
jgi:hypothetical protein